MFHPMGLPMNKDDTYWLRVCYVVFAAIVGYTAWKAIGTLGVQTGWVDRFDDWYGTAAGIGAVVLALLGTWLLIRDRERNDYFLQAIGELRKVSWPSMLDTRRMTTVVVIVVGIFAVILAIFDLIWGKIFGLLLS
ncbi:MAG: preprotein translocase subunit SecE [Proteobacteria bacterium]|nr:MAG: preprotein translocase subunit SecE [Pseudomonadota bacterium]